MLVCRILASRFIILVALTLAFFAQGCSVSSSRSASAIEATDPSPASRPTVGAAADVAAALAVEVAVADAAIVESDTDSRIVDADVVKGATFASSGST